jgi:hypothetical protein
MRNLLKNTRALFATGVLMLLLAASYAQAVTFSTSATVSNGGVSIVGALTKGSGTFVIDHPLDPKNKLLYHSFVESDTRKNIYDGVVTLSGNGEATIELPDYFLSLNEDIRYLVTPLGASMPNVHIKNEVAPRYFGRFGAPVFTIAGGVAGGKVSWQVTGNRHDPFAEAHPLVIEVPKGSGQPVNTGEYICDDCYEK